MKGICLDIGYYWRCLNIGIPGLILVMKHSQINKYLEVSKRRKKKERQKMHPRSKYTDVCFWIMKLEKKRENVRPSGAQERQLRHRNGSWHKGKAALGKYLSL